MRKNTATVAIAAALLLLTVVPSRTAGHAWITILSTTDVHGNILPVDYYTGRPDPRGLAKVATLARQIRKENPSGTLLIDSGDTIQGTPLEYLHARNDGPLDPMMLAMNALGVVAMAVGNHEYNYGLTVLEKARGEAHFPWLSANTYDRGTPNTHYQPYIVKEIEGVRLGVLGLTTPDIPLWEDKKNYAGLEFHDPLAEAKKWVPILRTRERADAVVIAMHMGLEEDLAAGQALPQLPNENEALAIARQVPGVDLILMGHTHREVPSLFVNGVLLSQAGFWGHGLARADITLDKDAGQRWKISARQARTVPVLDSTPADPEIAKLAEPYDRETRSWLERVVGDSDAELTLEDALFHDSALLDLVQRVQLDAGQADVSMAAVFNRRARLPKGDVRVRDIAGVYVYDNTLVVLEVTGKQLKDALEHSARFFRVYEPGKTAAELVDTRIPEYNFDVAEGVSYDLNITQPFGQRIQNLRFKGQPLDPTRKLRLATNNYRVNGGGGYTMYDGTPEVSRSSKEIRDMMIEWVEQHHHVPGQPSNNWRLIAR
jgi:2',3'-cyclic-nucleotide 2'-phosphodiesterase/3'-nucleotidase